MEGQEGRMKIAQIAPLFESVPPRLYGGTERVVSYLTEELVRLGHDVTLFASGDSITSAKLVACSFRAFRLDPKFRDPIPHQMVLLDKVSERAHEFDILHFHTDYLHFPLFKSEPFRTVTTLHGRQDLSDQLPFYKRFPHMPLVSISNAQRVPLSRSNFIGTVYHGLPSDLLPFNEHGGSYLAFLGRIAPEKRPDRAIEVARRAGLPLKIAAKVDRADESYFRETIAPLLDTPGVEFVGEINERAKAEFLGNASALLFPIDWPEPFGLVMIEAMACGTPVLAFRCGSIPEIIEDGVTGRIVSSAEEAIRALPEVLRLERTSIRHAFERRFSAERMATTTSKYIEDCFANSGSSGPPQKLRDLRWQRSPARTILCFPLLPNDSSRFFRFRQVSERGVQRHHSMPKTSISTIPITARHQASALGLLRPGQ
jgi:glycosyltransferase involved in cell wall biosynthesis